MKPANRASGLPPHEMADLLAAVRQQQAAGHDVISLAMGDPDLPPPAAVTAALTATVPDPRANRYPPFGGTAELRTAFADRIRHRYGVELDPESEVLPLVGSKEGLAHFALAFLNPGDHALVPGVAYGIYRSATLLAEGVVREYPLLAEDEWQPDLPALDAAAEAATVLWLNYPHNPTGGVAAPELFERIIELGQRRDLIVAHDLAYGDVYFEDSDRPLSIFQFEGARQSAVEFHSLSKSFNMCGFRVGALIGSAETLAVLRRLKLNVDNGMYLPIQAAAVAALGTADEWIADRNAVYAGRRDLVVRRWRSLGLPACSPRAGLYVWAAIPAGEPARAFALRVLEQAHVAVTPGTAYGAQGEGFVRISLTVPDSDLEEAIERIAAVV
jgi:LL-diaminopimelate aminotransferase